MKTKMKLCTNKYNQEHLNYGGLLILLYLCDH